MHIIATDKEKETPTVNVNTTKDRDKLDVLIELIEKTPKGKFLVFANFSKTFEKIELALKNILLTFGFYFISLWHF